MNGVRRLLGAASSNPPSPAQQEQQLASPAIAFSPKSGPSWPPSSPSTQNIPIAGESPKTTPALFLRKDKQKATPPDDLSSNSSPQSTRITNGNSSYTHTPSQSLSRSFLNDTTSPTSQTSSPKPVTRKSVNGAEWKRTSGFLDTRDELLMSLLASEAVVDSREFEILSSEDVEELKKEQQVLSSRLGAMSKKLSLETKIRDAAQSLSKMNASHRKVSKQTEEQLEAANKRVEAAQKELWRVSERVNEVHKKLMEHRAGVLSFSVRSMEKKMATSVASEDSGYDSSNRSTLMSPTTSSISGIMSPSSKTRFDGAHLFAGHADAIVPKKQLSKEVAAFEYLSLEKKLKEANEELATASKMQTQLSRDLNMMKLEKQEVETMMGMELQNAEETIAALEKELPRLEGLDAEVQQLLEEKAVWERERSELERQRKHIEELEARLLDSQLRSGEAEGAHKVLSEVQEAHRRQLEEKERELDQLQADWDADRHAWEQERSEAEDEKMEDLSRLQDEMERLREEDNATIEKLGQQLDDALALLRTFINKFGIVMYSRDGSIQGLLESVRTHLEALQVKIENHAKNEAEWDTLRRKLEDDVRSGLDKRESLARDLEEARKERDALRRDTLSLETRVKNADMVASLRSPKTVVPQPLPEVPSDVDGAKVISVLQMLWTILPSPEARAAKFGNSTQRSYRTSSPTPSNGSGTNGNGNVTSLSDLDVRALKALYDNRQTPNSPKFGNGTFTVDAFAARVQALINDDRALIERLLRFAQAHDLLKKNAERAQKLAQDGNAALETYQKQVRILEERNMSLAARQAAMQEEFQELHDAIERITAEKTEVEMLAAEQAEACRELAEANNTLSAQTLSLAEEAAAAPEKIRKQLEQQLAECKAELEAALDELEAMRSSEQSQRIALLDELNSMQTENSSLRAQIRAAKK